MGKMKFSRSLFGYAPVEVERMHNEVLAKYESEKKELLLLIENANKEHERLMERRENLTTNLQSARDSSVYLYNKEVFDVTLNRAERNAYSKIQEIKDEQDAFTETINRTIEEIDSVVAILKQEYLQITNALNQVIETIPAKSESEDQIAVSLDRTIEGIYSRYESSTEPFKAFTFNAHLVDIKKQDGLKGVDLKNEHTPITPHVIPIPSNKVINVSTRKKRPKTAVIAENDSEISSLLTYILEREGFKILLATDGYVLSEMIKEKEAPGIVILDTLLPYIQSNMLIKEIRESETWNDVPILMTTSEHSKQVIIEALEYGANDSLEKPFNPRELVARVKRLSMNSTKISHKVGV